MTTLIQQVKNLQKIKGISDMEFSRVAGIHFTSWSRIKNGHRTPSARVLGAIARAYPELQLAIFEYMMGNGGDKSTSPSAAPQSKSWRYSG